MKNYDLTIAIPVYERDDFFFMAVNSAINQTSTCIIIIVDNNSSHNRFKDFIENLNMPHIKYFKNETNLGMIGNWNRCIELCTTKYLSILHDDDILHSQFVESVQKIIEPWDILFTQSEVGSIPSKKFDKKFDTNKFRTKRIDVNYFVFGNFNYAPGTVFNVEAAKELGGFSNEYGFILDFHMWLKFAKNFRAVYSASKLSFYRESAIQGTRTLYKDMILNTYKLVNLVPAYQKYKILRLVSDYLIFSGGLDIHLLNPAKEIGGIEIEFESNPQFIKDYSMFAGFYKLKIISVPLRKGIKMMFKVYLNYGG